MEARPKPVDKAGNRNLYCPYYEGCLDHAVERHWQQWNCTECSHKQRQQSSGSVRTNGDTDQTYELPRTVYREVRHR